MTLVVTGVETIEITDPKGVCNPPAPVGSIGIGGYPPAPPSQPYYPQVPVVPMPGQPYPSPYTGDPLPNSSHIWTKLGSHAQVADNVKWGQGLPQTTEPQKWQKNWKAKMSPEQMQEAFNHGYTAITQ